MGRDDADETDRRRAGKQVKYEKRNRVSATSLTFYLSTFYLSIYFLFLFLFFIFHFILFIYFILFLIFETPIGTKSADALLRFSYFTCLPYFLSIYLLFIFIFHLTSFICFILFLIFETLTSLLRLKLTLRKNEVNLGYPHPPFSK